MTSLPEELGTSDKIKDIAEVTYHHFEKILIFLGENEHGFWIFSELNRVPCGFRAYFDSYREAHHHWSCLCACVCDDAEEWHDSLEMKQGGNG